MQNIITIYILCPEQNHWHNFIQHQTNYLIDKYRKYNIKHKFIQPNKKNYHKLMNDYNVFSYPSYIIQDKDHIKIYNGSDINKVENFILEFVN